MAGRLMTLGMRGSLNVESLMTRWTVATVELTIEQILTAVRQLSPKELDRLKKQIGSSGGTPPLGQLSTPKGKRMSQLLIKGNEGKLTEAESRELDRLVEDFEERTLDMAKALKRSANGPKKSPRPTRGRRKKAAG